MTRTLDLAGQALLYACFALALGVFSRWPVYQPLPPDMAQIKVSLHHHGARLAECTSLSAEELAKLPPNMRKATRCERERAPVRVQVDLDGQTVLQQSAAPAGLSRDGASTLYRRLDVPAGVHRLTVRIDDTAAGQGFNHERSQTIDLRPAQVMVIDFNADKGGIVLQ